MSTSFCFEHDGRLLSVEKIIIAAAQVKDRDGRIVGRIVNQSLEETHEEGLFYEAHFETADGVRLARLIAFGPLELQDAKRGGDGGRSVLSSLPRSAREE